MLRKRGDGVMKRIDTEVWFITMVANHVYIAMELRKRQLEAAEDERRALESDWDSKVRRHIELRIDWGA